MIAADNVGSVRKLAASVMLTVSPITGSAGPGGTDDSTKSF